MFVDKQELNSLHTRKYNIESLLGDDAIGEKAKEALRDELMEIEDEIKTIEKNCIVAR